VIRRALDVAPPVHGTGVSSKVKARSGSVIRRVLDAATPVP
jgi:hypothetical protein